MCRRSCQAPGSCNGGSGWYRLESCAGHYRATTSLQVAPAAQGCHGHSRRGSEDTSGIRYRVEISKALSGPSAPDVLPQAALASPRSGNGNARLACAWLNRSPAISRHEPQLDPHPVRMVSSARLTQPFSAASRIWWSVTPLQMQTYTVSVGCWRSGKDRR